MFCSNCGKTLKGDSASCPHCGAVVGESRFDGHPYTGAQVRTKPGEAVRLPGNHTKTTFMGTKPQPDGDVDARTTYRATRAGDVPQYAPAENASDIPADDFDAPYGDDFAPEADFAPEDDFAPVDEAPEESAPESAPEESAPEAAPRAEKPRAKAKPARKRAPKPAEEDDEEAALDEIRPRDIKLDKRGGISEDVKRIMGELRDDAPASAPKKPSRFKTKKKRETFDEDEPFAPAEAEDMPPEDEPLDGFDDLGDPSLEDAAFETRKKGVSDLVKYAAAAVVILAVLAGVIVGISYLTQKTKKAPIDGVTLTLYNQGIELMQSRVGESYKSRVMGNYNASDPTTLAVFSAAISRDLDEIPGMLPENPAQNDQRFLDALTAIQENINVCFTNDVMSLTDTTKDAAQKQTESNDRWAAVRQMVTALNQSTSAAQLDAIIKGERLEVIQQTTPEPAPTDTPAPYAVLSKGSKGAAVTELQTRLTELGYLNSEIDGEFGNKTKTAVQLFQQTAGLTVDGIASVDTQIQLYAEDAPKNPAAK